MARQLLEDTCDFIIDRAHISEAKDPSGRACRKIPGVLSVCDCVNGNKRKYPKKVWEKNLQDGSALRGLLGRKASFGRLEHPKDGQVNLESEISHLTIDVRLVERELEGKKQWVVEGDILVLENEPSGRKIMSLIDAGYTPLVSSRGYGSLVKDSAGIDEVQDDYVCEGWDIVSQPSFVQAALTPVRTNETVVKPSHVTNVVVTETGTAATNIIATISPTPAAPATVKPKPTHTMEISQIRESVRALKAIDPKGLNARDFAHGLSEMGNLHAEAAKALAADSSKSWDVDQLHRELTSVEETWAAAYEAPRQEGTRLLKEKESLLKVIKGVASHALKVKTALAEKIKSADKSAALTEAVASRGRGWVKTARGLRQEGQLTGRKYTLACEALDVLAGRYKTDLADVGRRVLELEFLDLTEDEKKSLTEAKTPGQLVKVRAAIEEKRDKTTKKLTKPADGKNPPDAIKGDEGKGKSNDVAKSPGAVTHDSTPPKDESKPKLQEVRTSEPTHVMSEAIGLTRRLSKGTSYDHI